MARPNFLIPGASRSGTTSLHYYLREHPEIYMSNPKELRFFDRTENYQRGLDYYEQFFADGVGMPARGEVSPPYWNHGITFDTDGNYRWDPEDDAPRRIYEAYPNIKLIFTLRNPISRAYSQYWKNIGKGREQVYPFIEAIQRELSGERDKTESECCWVYKNRYPIHLKRWLDLFDKERMLFLVFEEWVDDTKNSLNTICNFLNIRNLKRWSRTGEKKNETKIPRNMWINRMIKNKLDYLPLRAINSVLNMKKDYPDMDLSTKKFMKNVFNPTIDETESIIDRSLDVWRL